MQRIQYAAFKTFPADKRSVISTACYLPISSKSSRFMPLCPREPVLQSVAASSLPRVLSNAQFVRILGERAWSKPALPVLLQKFVLLLSQGTIVYDTSRDFLSQYFASVAVEMPGLLEFADAPC
jgi:hypothetical protein